jgi:hypothetical protein
MQWVEVGANPPAHEFRRRRLPGRPGAVRPGRSGADGGLLTGGQPGRDPMMPVHVRIRRSMPEGWRLPPEPFRRSGRVEVIAVTELDLSEPAAWGRRMSGDH